MWLGGGGILKGAGMGEGDICKWPDMVKVRVFVQTINTGDMLLSCKLTMNTSQAFLEY